MFATANGVNALRHLDLYDQFLACAHCVQTMTYAKLSGRILSQISLLDSALNQNSLEVMKKILVGFNYRVVNIPTCDENCSIPDVAKMSGF